MTSVHTNVLRVYFQLVKVVENSDVIFILGAEPAQTS